MGGGVIFIVDIGVADIARNEDIAVLGYSKPIERPAFNPKSPIPKIQSLLHLVHWLVGAPNMRLTTAFSYVQ